jgi:hypothetical protein
MMLREYSHTYYSFLCAHSNKEIFLQATHFVRELALLTKIVLLEAGARFARQNRSSGAHFARQNRSSSVSLRLKFFRCRAQIIWDIPPRRLGFIFIGRSLLGGRRVKIIGTTRFRVSPKIPEA